MNNVAPGNTQTLINVSAAGPRFPVHIHKQGYYTLCGTLFGPNKTYLADYADVTCGSCRRISDADRVSCERCSVLVSNYKRLCDQCRHKLVSKTRKRPATKAPHALVPATSDHVQSIAQMLVDIARDRPTLAPSDVQALRQSAYALRELAGVLARIAPDGVLALPSKQQVSFYVSQALGLDT